MFGVMRALSSIIIALNLSLFGCAAPSTAKYDRSLFNTGSPVAGTEPTKAYDPFQLGTFYNHRHETELKMFDLINEAALRRDKRIQSQLDLYRDSLGYIPSLALRHYKYVFGDASQLDWLLAEDAKHGFGGDSLIVTVFGYIDEWDRTIRHFKQHDKVADGAGAEVLHAAIATRKRIYGAERFEAAWNRIQ
jgi:hypothetical protein